MPGEECDSMCIMYADDSFTLCILFLLVAVLFFAAFSVLEPSGPALQPQYIYIVKKDNEQRARF